VVERLRLEMIAQPISTIKRDLNVTVSFGVAVSGGVNEPLDQLLARADTALYRAKAAGRNRVEFEDGALLVGGVS